MQYLAYLLFISYSFNLQYSTSLNVAVLKQNSSVNLVNKAVELSCSYNSTDVTASYYVGAGGQLSLEDSLQNLYRAIGLKNYDLSYEVFRYGMVGFFKLQQQGKLGTKNLLSIIDFTKSSCKKRFYTIDLDELQLKYYTYVSHGKNTGEDLAKNFSNDVHSNQSSLGFYVTAETYIGSKGYSLKLDGVEQGYNDNLRERAVVMHAADYVSEYWIKRYKRLGRSQGCPALPENISMEVIDAIKNGTAIFAYYDDVTYLAESTYLNTNRLLTKHNMLAKLAE